MIDVRSPGEYSGELLHMPDYPQEGALRGGHIPGAKNVPWARAAAEDATFRPRKELEAIYGGEAGLSPADDVIVYCRIGERSSHTWFVLHHLLGYPDGAQLRRLLDRVGQQRPRPHHPGGQTVTSHTLNPRLQDIVDEFGAVPGQEKLQLLLEFSEELPPLPARYAEHRDLLEPVPECQSPLFLAVEVAGDGTAHLFFDAPPEAPTTRGFAGILQTGAGRAERGRRCWPRRPSSPPSSACPTWSARCGCAAWPRCWPGSSARSAGSRKRSASAARAPGRGRGRTGPVSHHRSAATCSSLLQVNCSKP